MLPAFRDVAASMAHSVATAKRVYDLHGKTQANQRLAGMASLERQRQATTNPAAASTVDTTRPVSLTLLRQCGTVLIPLCPVSDKHW